MDLIVFYLSIAWTAFLLGLTVVLVILARSPTVRILALDMLMLILIALLVLFAQATQTAYYLDAAFVLAILSFVGTLAAARYRSEGRIF